MAVPSLSFSFQEKKNLYSKRMHLVMGLMLSQVQGETEKVTYVSRVLSKTEKNYCLTRRELLAMVKSIKHFHHYLYGRHFLIRTNHVLLRWLMSFKDLKGQLACSLEKLQQYNFEICHRKERMHGNANGLSRHSCLEAKCIVPE